MATLFNTKIKDTYQSLLKLEDNTILTTTSKNITDGLGNASPLYLSTTRVGIGTNAPTNTLEVSGSTKLGQLTFNNQTIANTVATQITINSTSGIDLTSSLGARFYAGYLSGAFLATTSGFFVGNEVPGSISARLQVKGSGSTSATTSLLVQNSSAVDLLKLQDNGVLTLGTVASGLGKIVVTTDPSYGIKSVMENNSGGQIIRQVSTDVIWFGGQTQTGIFANNLMNLVAPYITGNNPAGNTTASSFNFRVTGSPYGQTPSTASRGVLFDGGFGFQSGGYANYFELSPTYTFDVSNNRIVKGIYYNPTLVTPNTNDRHIAIETVTGDVLLATTSGQVGIGSTYGGWKLNVDGAIRAQRIDLTGSAAPGHVMLRIDDNGTVLRNNTFNINSGNGNAGQSANLAVGNTDTTVARLYVKGSGTTSATTSLLVQDNSGNSAFQITDDRAVSLIGGSTLKITSPLSSGAPIILSNNGATGGYRGGYDFKSGYNGSEGNTAFRIASPTTTSSFVGIGNLTDSDVAGGTGKLQIENTLSTGRNAAIKLRVNFADIINQYNGIQFDTIETGSGGAFMGSQRNTAGSGYGSDLVILTTTETPANTYTETARFVGKSQSLSIGAGKTPTARLQVQGSGSTSATTSLLVQNSSGTDALKITDDRVTLISNQLLVNDQFNTRILNTLNNNGGIAIGNLSLGSGSGRCVDIIQSNTNAYGGIKFYNDVAQTSRIGGFFTDSSARFILQTTANDVTLGTGLIATSSSLYVGYFTYDTLPASAAVAIKSTTQGFLPPRVTTAQKNAISSPAEGLFVYDSDLKRPCFFNGATWITL